MDVCWSSSMLSNKSIIHNHLHSRWIFSYQWSRGNLTRSCSRSWRRSYRRTQRSNVEGTFVASPLANRIVPLRVCWAPPTLTIYHTSYNLFSSSSSTWSRRRYPPNFGARSPWCRRRVVDQPVHSNPSEYPLSLPFWSRIHPHPQNRWCRGESWWRTPSSRTRGWSLWWSSLMCRYCRNTTTRACWWSHWCQSRGMNRCWVSLWVVGERHTNSIYTWDVLFGLCMQA